MAAEDYESWGRYPRAEQEAVRLRWRNEPLPEGALARGPVLPYGNGRSYGDVCLNDGGTLLDCRGLDRFIAFDREAGILRCEGGVLLSEIISLVVPHGWFLPVVPGTQFVTVGGAIANDVHGKNHHGAGTFGRHVRRLELLRSDGGRMTCGQEENPDWHRATIAGLGLTGVITWAELALKRVPGPGVECETLRMAGLRDFFELTRASDEHYEYTVAWIDGTAGAGKLGRGLFMRANHSAAAPGAVPAATPRLDISRLPPLRLVNRPGIRLFNALYLRRISGERSSSRADPQRFFFPLDGIGGWNRLYGRRGLLQYQFVVPERDAESVVEEILRKVSESDCLPFLTVIKRFGDHASPGLLSFPRPGITLALDFPNLGYRTMALLDELDPLVTEAGGAIYPAKDARMPPATFQACFPRWRDLLPYVDPGISSGFWRRVTREPE